MRWVAWLWLLTASSSWAQNPARISYQGRLLNDAGQAVSSNVYFRIDLFSASQNGTQLYSEDVGWISVQDGMYAFSFGTNAASLIQALTNNECWLESSVNGGALTPRHRLLAVPYAFHADMLDGRDASAFATGTPVYVEMDPIWNAQKSSYATGAPLYGFTEADPVWATEKSLYATGTPLYGYSEADPIWLAERANYATGSPVYAEADPLWNA
ncbi:MAG TPA: hypothetical protein DCZ95_19370, partial [Verrucomicrobia bacterium]|nr:hypothetical protein [Verrucomicrobiota bacterium]